MAILIGRGVPAPAEAPAGWAREFGRARPCPRATTARAAAAARRGPARGAQRAAARGRAAAAAGTVADTAAAPLAEGAATAAAPTLEALTAAAAPSMAFWACDRPARARPVGDTVTLACATWGNAMASSAIAIAIDCGAPESSRPRLIID